MKDEKNDEVWEILKQAKAPSVPPFFSWNVLRVVRQESETRPLLAFWRRWKVALLAVTLPTTALLLLTIFISSGVAERKVAAAEPEVPEQDYEVVVHLDELIAMEENALWLEKGSF